MYTFLYMTDNIFPVLPIKHLVNKDNGPTIPHKLKTRINPSASNLCVLFCPCALQNATVHVATKALNMRHKSQNGFNGIFVEIPQHQKGYLFYIPSTQK